jgi:hypothetical protein
MLHTECTEWAVISVMCINHKMLSDVVSLIFHFQFVSLNNRGCVRCVPCSLVEVCQHFRRFCCLHHQGRRTCHSLWSIWCLFVNQFMYLYLYPVVYCLLVLTSFCISSWCLKIMVFWFYTDHCFLIKSWFVLQVFMILFPHLM